MVKENNTQQNHEISIEYVCIYYTHQYERMAKLEEQRLIISNIVLTLSIAVYAYGFSNIDGLTVFTGIGIPIVLFLANLFAISYILHSADVIQKHKDRAKEVLKEFAEYLYHIDKKYKWSEKWPRWKNQILIHILLIIIAVIPIIIYIETII